MQTIGGRVPLVKFVGTTNHLNGTTRIKLADGPDGVREIVRGGDAMEVSSEELRDVLGCGCPIEIVDDAEVGVSAPGPGSVSPPTSSDPAFATSTTFKPPTSSPVSPGEPG
jgi:hypothetical protein